MHAGMIEILPANITCQNAAPHYITNIKCRGGEWYSMEMVGTEFCVWGKGGVESPRSFGQASVTARDLVRI